MEDLLSLRARTTPERPALVAAGRTVSYAQLDAAASAAARRLAALGVAPGERVASTLPAGLEFASLLHGAAKLGAVLAPLNTRLTAAERRAQVEAADARLVVEEPLDGAEVEPAAPPPGPDDPWTLLFTSGTTGRPKPVLLSHRNQVASAIAAAWALGVAPDDRWLCVLPVFHVGGLAILVRAAVHGTTAALEERFDPAAVAASIAAGGATLVSLVPTMLRRLAELGLDRAPGLRAILLGGSSAPPDLLGWAAARGLPVVRTYGMTETASQVAVAPAAPPSSTDAAAVHPGARPLPGVELRIGLRAEILVRGPMVARGALAPDGWLHTGDRGRLDEQGRLHVVGRLDEAIVTGGENVSAHEVEQALLRHPAVVEAAVVGEPDTEWGEAVIAYVVATGGVGADELRAHCRGLVADFKVPKRVDLVGALPRNAAGELRRDALRDRSPRVTPR